MAPAGNRGGRHHGSKRQIQDRWSSSSSHASSLKASEVVPHLTAAAVRQENVHFVGEEVCAKSKLPKKWVKLDTPNIFNVTWTYSVPCGACNPNGSWILLTCVKSTVDADAVASSLITELGWKESDCGQGFVCPECYAKGW